MQLLDPASYLHKLYGNHMAFAILAILHLCLLRYFPSTNLVDRADNCYTSLYFYFSSFSMFNKALICGLGGNAKTTEPMKCLIFTDTRFCHERPR